MFCSLAAMDLQFPNSATPKITFFLQSVICIGRMLQLCSKLFNPLAFPYDFYRNKSCNINCCVNSMLPINQNMIVSQGLELILSMFRRTTVSGQHPLI